MNPNKKGDLYSYLISALFQEKQERVYSPRTNQALSLLTSRLSGFLASKIRII